MSTRCAAAAAQQHAGQHVRQIRKAAEHLPPPGADDRYAAHSSAAVARLLLPPRFRASEPQRVCEMCEGLLAPLQGFLVGAAAASVQPPVHDALDSVSLRSWLNAPYSSSMQVELYKAANILQAYVKARCCAALTACLCSAVCCELLTHSSCLTLAHPFMPATMLCYDIHLKPMEPLLQCTRSHYDCMQSNLFLCL